MDKRIAIKVENLSKAYQLGQIGTGTISRDLERFWTTKIRGKEDPFLKIGETNDRTVKGESDIVWSLKDINFEIEQGDAIGIIGRNGAGKSTLLKLLSRVTAPTTGNIKVKGRIASLLEVGTGFHPELTGRENIYLNGAILGMRKKEITRKFDEIVDFSGVERYIDTPVKRYSSGMYVRLAFAVAAHLESEILIVDEVLAVGDAEFQKKCLGKMGEVSKGEGRTVLFVSHNMESILSLCQNTILIKNGIIDIFDKTEFAINNYLRSNFKNMGFNKDAKIFCYDIFEIKNFLVNKEFVNININQGENWNLTFDVIKQIIDVLDFKFNIELKTIDGIAITCFGNEFQKHDLFLSKSTTKIEVDLGICALKEGEYSLNLFFQVGTGITAKSCYMEDYCLIRVDPPIKTNNLWNKYINQLQHGHVPILWKEIK
jgi:lipopolysaccharide transport system ATP-binding protein